MPKIAEEKPGVITPTDDQVSELAVWIHEAVGGDRPWSDLGDEVVNRYHDVARNLFVDTPVCLTEWITEQLLKD